MKTIKTFIMLCAAATLFATNAHTKEIRKDIIVNSSRGIMTAPLWIAEAKGYFQQEGLNVKIRGLSSGKAAFAAMLNKTDIDISTAADTPIVFHSFKRNDFVIIAAMANSDLAIKILVRQDKGIKKPLDLIGKKIGLIKGSAAQFFLDVFLTHKGVLPSKVKVISLKPPELPQALADGRVEAICVWEPYISNAKKLLGKKVLIMPSRGVHQMSMFLVARKLFAKTNPVTIKRFLKAIEKAEDFIQKNEEESINIIVQRLNANKGLTALFWQDYRFQLILDQSILVALEDIARWIIKEHLTGKQEVPNYLDFIYMDPLEQVNPSAVTIIR